MNPKKDFWKYYMSEHTNKTNRLLHVVGTCSGVGLFIFFLFYNVKFIFIAPLVAYGLAWTGHFVFEKNKPATFKYPIQSFKSDFKMTWLTLTKPFRQSR